LKAQGRPEEAEAVYRETVRTFRDDVFARNGLGEVLKAQGRLEEGEAVYLETVKLFPQNAYAQTGLQAVLRARGHASPEIEDFDSTRMDNPETPPDPRRESVERAIASPVSEVREAPAVPYLGRNGLEILLQDVYLLRRWGGASRAPGAARERARKILSKLVREDSNTKVVETLGLLQIEDGDLDQALALLREAARRFPGSARVRYVLARAEREAAARRGRLDYQKPEAPVLSWRRLGRLDERFRPLQLLGEARTWLVQTDGAIVAENARNCLDQLGRWVRRVKPFAEISKEKDLPESSRFVSWWGGEAERYLFESTPVAASADLLALAPIQERIEAQTIPLNRLEEDWLQHYARA
jgi:tetratricopeptide (TPR) repeat protein